MLDSTPHEEPGWDAVFDTAESLEDVLLRIADCLRTERECVTSFDASRLMEVLEERNELMDEFEALRRQRRSAVESVWASRGLSEPLPEEFPDVLRNLAAAPDADSRRLRDTASALEALRDVVAELYELNRVLLERAMNWINRYVADLVGTATTGAYDGSGRVRATGGAMLRRTI